MIAGIDLGGSLLRVAIAHSDGRILATRRTPQPALRTPRTVTHWAAEQITRLSNGDPLRSVGIGAPGPIDPRRGVLVNPPNLPGWTDVPLTSLVRELLDCP